MNNKGKQTKRQQMISLSVLIAVAAFLVWLVTSTVTKYHLYGNLAFYFGIIIMAAWLCVPIMTILLSKKYLRNPNGEVVKLIASVEWIIGVPGSIILGDILFHKGAVLLFAFALLSMIVGFSIITYNSIKSN